MSPALQPQSTNTLPEIYAQAVAAGKLKKDEAQQESVQQLEALRLSLAQSPANKPRKLIGKLFAPSPTPITAKNLYIWGDVGRGKSLLMDMFYNIAPVEKKRRIHFHELMLEIHAKAHDLRKHNNNENPIAQVAHKLAAQYRLLCLDEFQVTDVADAMILHKLFDTLLAEGVTFVITSNRPPAELYKGGLQREKFLAFVQLVNDRMDVLNLNAQQDYRMQRLRAMQTVYFTPRSEEADRLMRETLAQFANFAEREPITLEVQGRSLKVNECYGSVAMFTFSELCEKPLGSADFLAIAKRFTVVFLSSIPRLSSEKRNEARRFVTLIDALYDRRTKLICTADAPPEKLYVEGDGHFEFQRTVSRLVEMQSESYLTSKHLP